MHQKNPLKRIFTKKYTFTICVGRIWIVIGYFLFKNETFNGLLKVNGIQKKNLLNKTIIDNKISKVKN